MRTNPFYDAWLFLLGQTSDHQNSGVGPLLTLLFLALLIGSAWIAWRNWKDDAEQRTSRHLVIWLMRVLIGSMWFQGSLWKLPLPVSGGFSGWTQALGDNAAFEFHQWIAKKIFVPLLPVINPIVFFTELSLAVAFILGFFVRPMAAIGMLFVTHLWLGLYHHPAEWPWLYIFLIFVQAFFLLDHAGMSLGLDALIRRKPFRPFNGSNPISRVYRRLA
jgi:uncharacterized membrane protein YphA (DoxX/SURF4 family)